MRDQRSCDWVQTPQNGCRSLSLRECAGWARGLEFPPPGIPLSFFVSRWSPSWAEAVGPSRPTDSFPQSSEKD